MEQGIIFTKDKKDIEVFFLKPQQPPSECFNALEGSEPPPEHHIFEPLHGEVIELIDSESRASCCPSGPKGEEGPSGVNENDTLYSVISDSIERFEETQLNLSSKTAQEILALVIEKKVKSLLNHKGNL